MRASAELAARPRTMSKQRLRPFLASTPADRGYVCYRIEARKLRCPFLLRPRAPTKARNSDASFQSPSCLCRSSPKARSPHAEPQTTTRACKQSVANHHCKKMVRRFFKVVKRQMDVGLCVTGDRRGDRLGPQSDCLRRRPRSCHDRRRSRSRSCRLTCL